MARGDRGLASFFFIVIELACIWVRFRSLSHHRAAKALANLRVCSQAHIMDIDEDSDHIFRPQDSLDTSASKGVY